MALEISQMATDGALKRSLKNIAEKRVLTVGAKIVGVSFLAS